MNDIQYLISELYNNKEEKEKTVMMETTPQL